jgi:hypothetical protein
MVFDAHHIGLDHHKLINIRRFGGMVNSPKAKLLSNMPKWKPFCTIIDDAPTKIASNMVNGLFYFHPFQFLFNLFMFAYSCF